ncbi:MAG: response regulator [Mariprofundales bacterium]
MWNLLRDLNVRQKILLPMLIALLAVILLGGVFLERIKEDHAVLQRIQHSERSLNALRQLREDLLNIETGERGFLLTGELIFLEPYQLGLEQFRSDLNTVRARISEHPQMLKMLHQLEKISSHLFLTVMDPLVTQRKQATILKDAAAANQALKNATSTIIAGKSKDLMDQMRVIFVRMIDIEAVHLFQLQKSLGKSSTFTIWVLVSALVLSILMLLWVGWLVARKISQPLQQLTKTANAIAGGDLKQEIELTKSGDEIGELNRAMAQMRDHLIHTVARLESENWLQDQVEKAGSSLQGMMDQQDLTKRALEVTMKKIDALCGCFYVLPANNQHGEFELVAHQDCGDELAHFRKINDGVLGHCRKDHSVRLLESVPQNYLTIRSALGAATAPNVVIMPITYEGSLLGVIEMATLKPVSQAHQQLLSKIAQRVGVSLYSVHFTMRIEDLLQESDLYRVELEEKATELEQTSTYKSQFLASMSHEIRTPMNAILGMGELLEESALTHEQREYVGILQSAGNGLLRIINDILDISKIESGEMKLDPHPFNLREMVERTGEMLAIQAHKKSLELLMHVDESVPPLVAGDEGRLQQILINLLNNAVKFTDVGEVALHLHALDVRETAGERRQHLLFEVEDSGIGIADDKLEHIFGSFTQADASMTRRFGGTGLGLSISRQLVAQMGGEIKVSSKLGEGSCFMFEIAMPISDTVEALEAVTMDSSTMLVVDDNASCRNEISYILSQWGVEVLQAASGSEALTIVDARDPSLPPLDMVLIDCDMPGMDGFTLTGMLQTRAPAMRELLFMLTTDKLVEYKNRSQQLGVELFLAKPIKQSALHNLMLGLLQPDAKNGREQGRAGSQQAEPSSIDSIVKKLPKLLLLIAEDDNTNQILISKVMERWGIEYDIVDNGQDAVVVARHRHFDAILMDVNMPILDGIEATKQIRLFEKGQAENQAKVSDGKVASHVPIIALTALAFPEDERKCMDAGMDAFLIKPIRQHALAKLLQSMVEDGTIVVPEEDDLATNSASNQMLSENKPPFEYDVALAHNDNDADLLELLITSLQQDLPKQMAALEQALASEDCERIWPVAHKLKGALGNLGENRVTQTALQLEQVGKRGDLSQCQDRFLHLQSMVEQLLSALTRVSKSEENE